MSKILYEWVLERELERIAVKCNSFQLSLLGSGEWLGEQKWDEAVLKEARGSFLFAHHSDVRKLLYHAAIRQGAIIRFNSNVESTHLPEKAVRLESGVTLTGDVIIGADGQNGLTRQLLNEDCDDGKARFTVYSSTVNVQRLLADSNLAHLANTEKKSLHDWFGDEKCVCTFPLTARQGNPRLLCKCITELAVTVEKAMYITLSRMLIHSCKSLSG